MLNTPGVAGRLFGALAAANVKVLMIDQGSSGINIIVGTESADFEKAIRAIYAEFAGLTSPESAAPPK
jgi:aspartate kinase